jgi:pimeloyl-ACP methyl ester carboxylesterase
MSTTELLVDGFRVPFSILGENRTAPLVICVNAAQQTMGAWGFLAKRFMRRGYRVAMFDFPNQGTALEIDAALGLIQQADLTAAVARELSPDRQVALTGASWGSLVATACAARHNEIVNRLMLGSFQARTHPMLQAVCQRCVELIDAGEARAEMADFFIREFGSGLSENFRAVMRKQFANVSDAQLMQMRRQCETLALGADLREVVDMRRITGHVLIVNGAEDPLVDVTNHETMGGCFQNAETQIIAGVGHFLHLERPGLIDMYVDFMRDTSDDQTVQPFTPPILQGAAMLTDLQKQKLTRLFHILDANDNGYLEPADAERLAHNIATARDIERSSPQFAALLRRYQESMALSRPFADASGRLNLNAFLQYHDWMLNMPGTYQLAVQRLVEFVFYALDEDGDGEVTLAEARLFYAAHGIDSDGFLTHAEATDIVTQFYFSSDPHVPGNWLFGPFAEVVLDA